MYNSKSEKLLDAASAQLEKWVGEAAVGELAFIKNVLDQVKGLRNQTFLLYSGGRNKDETRANWLTLRPSTPGPATWHHHEVCGLMQLVQTRYHAGKGKTHNGCVQLYEILTDTEYKK